jgi:hypothetical protein
MEKPEELIGCVPWEISPPTLTPDGRPSLEKAAELIEETFARARTALNGRINALTERPSKRGFADHHLS